MNNKPKVSIVVPIYNKEKILHKCLDSLVNQTMRDLEIILINDGSTDSSEIVCLDYVKKYPNLVQYHAFENGGVSKARNRGIDLASGEYIGFVDSDDWVDLNFCKYMYNALNHKMTLFDIVACDIKVVGDFDKIIIGSANTLETYVISDPIWRNAICNKFYKRKLLIENNIKFIDNCHIMEDLAFAFCAYSITTKITNINELLYFYNKNENSVTQQKQIRKSMVGELYSVVIFVCNFLKEQNIFEKIFLSYKKIFIDEILINHIPYAIRNRILLYPQECEDLKFKYTRMIDDASLKNTLEKSVCKYKFYIHTNMFKLFPTVIIFLKGSKIYNKLIEIRNKLLVLK